MEDNQEGNLMSESDAFREAVYIGEKSGIIMKNKGGTISSSYEKASNELDNLRKNDPIAYGLLLDATEADKIYEVSVGDKEVAKKVKVNFQEEKARIVSERRENNPIRSEAQLAGEAIGNIQYKNENRNINAKTWGNLFTSDIAWAEVYSYSNQKASQSS